MTSRPGRTRRFWGAKRVGPDVAAILLTTTCHDPERLKSESAFATLCGVSPLEV